MLLTELKKLSVLFDAETPNEVVINKSEFINCLQIATLRYSHNTFARRISDKTTQLQNIINGTVSEYALSKWLGVHWQPITDHPDTQDGDLGHSIQVRTTDLSDGKLIVKPTDPVNHVYVLLIGSTLETDPPYRYKVIGMLGGKECKRGKYLRDGGSYWIPQSDLEKVDKAILLRAF